MADISIWQKPGHFYFALTERITGKLEVISSHDGLVPTNALVLTDLATFRIVGKPEVIGFIRGTPKFRIKGAARATWALKQRPATGCALRKSAPFAKGAAPTAPATDQQWTNEIVLRCVDLRSEKAPLLQTAQKWATHAPRPAENSEGSRQGKIPHPRRRFAKGGEG